MFLDKASTHVVGELHVSSFELLSTTNLLCANDMSGCELKANTKSETTVSRRHLPEEIKFLLPINETSNHAGDSLTYIFQF